MRVEPAASRSQVRRSTTTIPNHHSVAYREYPEKRGGAYIIIRHTTPRETCGPLNSIVGCITHRINQLSIAVSRSSRGLQSEKVLLKMISPLPGWSTFSANIRQSSSALSSFVTVKRYGNRFRHSGKMHAYIGRKRTWYGLSMTFFFFFFDSMGEVTRWCRLHV